MTTTAMLVTAAVTSLIPWLTALVTKARAPQALKAGVTVLLASATGILVEWQGDPSFAWRDAILFAAEGFAVATLAHLGLWKPAGVTGSGGVIQRRVPGGVG